MRLTKLAAALAMIAVIPATAHAQYTAGKFQWVGVGNSFAWNYKATSSSSAQGIYGGNAYQARLAVGSNAFGPAADIFCVDFMHHVGGSTTSNYNAWFTKLGGGPLDLSKTRGGNSATSLANYLKAAWLVTKMQSFAASDHQNRANVHAAIWYMMSGQPFSVQQGTSGSTYNNASTVGNWITQANGSYLDGSVNAAEWSVVTDQCVAGGSGMTATDGCSQEFLTRNVVPEPATVILLGTGLLATLAMTGVLRRQTAA